MSNMSIEEDFKDLQERQANVLRALAAAQKAAAILNAAAKKLAEAAKRLAGEDYSRLHN